MDAEEVERQLEASGRESAVEEASTTAEETAEEQGRTNSTDANTDRPVSFTTAGARDGTNSPPPRPFRSAPSSSASLGPDDITLDQDLIAFMRDHSIDTSNLAAGAEREIAENDRTRAAFIRTTQLGSTIDNNMNFDDFLGGLDGDATELTTEEIPRLAERDEAARRDRSRRKFSRGLTARQEYTKAYEMLDKGWASGEERQELQLRVQMAMDRMKREKDEEGEGGGKGGEEAV